MHYYHAYGLNLRSDFPLPELIPGGDGADLYIQQGQVDLPAMENSHIPRQGIEAWFGGTVAEAYLHWPGVAKFRATGGDRLVVEPTAAAIDRQILSLFILSEALGLILHQRDLLLIHASAIQVGNQAVIFVGVPGAGKSTTAAAFAQAGYTVLADDMVAVDVPAAGEIVVLPAFPQVKVWPPSLVGLGYDTSTLEPLFPGSSKRVIRDFEDFPTEAIPLTHIFFIEKDDQGDGFTAIPLPGMKAMLDISIYFSCPQGLMQGAAQARHFRQCSQIIQQVGIWTLQRPRNFQTLQQFVDNIESFLADCQQQRQGTPVLQGAAHG